MSTNDLVFDVTGSTIPLVLSSYKLVIAGYTGRDATAVQAHIDELAAIGVPAPKTVPAFYEIDSALATTASGINVSGANTSGEVEPVLIRAGGRFYLGVGSDHTDRDVERASIADSKAACPKPIGHNVLALPENIDWDSVVVKSEVDGNLYQKGTLRSLRIPTAVLELFEANAGPVGDVVMFGGTLALIGGEFVAGTTWEMSLQVPSGPSISLRYNVTNTHTYDTKGAEK